MEKQIVKRQDQPAFVQQAMQSIEGMMQYADLLLQSGLCPDHFYDKGPDNKPDKSKGKPAAVVMVLQHGMEVGLSPMQSLQQVIPVNGLVSIKGDGAKSLIFQSATLEPGSWRESESGSIESGDYKFSITAKRRDNGLQMTRSFSVDDAKRAGLWITKEMLQRQDGWKKKLSSWYKYPKRMISYRALGFIARDLFQDVIAGMYTLEEATDLPQDQTQYINVGDSEVPIPDKEFTENRSKSFTKKASEEIDKRQEYNRNFADNKVPPEEEAAVITEAWESFTEDKMKEMSAEDLLEVTSTDEAMREAVRILPGKNTNKKLRNIIMERQKGTDKLIAYVKANNNNDTGIEYGNETLGVKGLTPEQITGNKNEEEAQPENEEEAPSPMEGMEVNENFDQEGEEPETQEETTDEPEDDGLPFEVSELPDNGSRPFDEISVLYNEFNQLEPPITNDRFLKLAGNLKLQDFESKEDFLRKATKEEITTLISEN